MDTLHAGQNGAVASQDPGLTLAEAASRLGVAPRTVRRRIQRSQIVAELVQGDHGAEYRVWLDRTPDKPPDRQAAVLSSPREEPAVSRLARVIEEQGRELARLQQERFEMAGRLGYFQAQLEQAQSTIKALEAPKEPEPAPVAPRWPEEPAQANPPPRPWWRFW